MSTSKMIFVVALAGCAALASAQVQVPVAITATVTGANSAPYEYGSYQISLVDSSGTVIQSSGTAIPPSFSGSLSSTGSLAVSIYPNSAFAPPPGTTATYWKFAICSAPAYPAPASLTWLDTYQQCYSSLVTVSAAGDYSTAVSVGAPALYYQDNKTGVAYFGSGGSGASSLSGGSAGAQPYQTVLNTTAFVYPATDTHNLTLSLNRTDSYVEDGTIERPYKNLPTLVIPSTGLASVFTSPNASYANSVATVLPAIPLTIYGNNSTWTVIGGLTLTAKTISYDLIDGAAVTYNYAGTDRSEKHGGAFLGNVNLAQGYLHAFGTNLSGNSNIFTVGGASTAALLYGEATTGSQKIASGGPGALIALYNPNMIKSSGYNIDMTAGGQLLFSGGILSTVAGTANIYLPTANSPTAAHAISGLISTSGTGVSCPNSNVYLAFGFNLTTETGCILVPGYQGPTVFYGQVSSDRIDARTLYSAAGTVLPACSSTYKGSRAVVGDATSPAYMVAYTSGGTITAEVICSYNGTTYSWLTH